MNACEARFIAEADAAVHASCDLQPVLQRLHEWKADLTAALRGHHLSTDRLAQDSDLAGSVRAINAVLAAVEHDWQRQWDDLAPARFLADRFDDRVVLLVFGKFNAGKSSFCNLLAERFLAHGRAVRYFHLESGLIVESDSPLHVGATETTAGVQGVCLCDKIVLLDTPGLHSVTVENAALTQRIVQSADAVLWLTSSTAPGQVQELGELARELSREKPLLPIITRSDLHEEDEVDGEIVTRLRNKTAANRALQELDVRQRASDQLVSLGLDPALLKDPVSISSHMARIGGAPDTAMLHAGFERLYDALEAIIGPALRYKQRKPAMVLLAHLQEDVLGSLQVRARPAIEKLHRDLATREKALPIRQDRIVRLAWRSVTPELPDLLDRYEDSRDVEAAGAEIMRMLSAAFGQQVHVELTGFVLLERDLQAERPDARQRIASSFESAGSRRDQPMSSNELLHATLQAAVRDELSHRAGKLVALCAEALSLIRRDALQLQETVAVHEVRLDALGRICSWQHAP